jgi:hypothetical protein
METLRRIDTRVESHPRPSGPTATTDETARTEARSVADTDVQIKFDAPAVLRKWPSLNNERISNSWGAGPYLIVEGTLDQCIRQIMSKPASTHRLYEIHTAPQGELVTTVLSSEQIVELDRLLDFL